MSMFLTRTFTSALPTFAKPCTFGVDFEYQQVFSVQHLSYLAYDGSRLALLSFQVGLEHPGIDGVAVCFGGHWRAYFLFVRACDQSLYFGLRSVL